MSKEYCEAHNAFSEKSTTDEMRLFCQRPGNHDEDGKPIYFTEQVHKRECDINYIISKYDKTGMINHVSNIEAKFGNYNEIEFKTMMDTVTNATTLFNSLPSKIRNRFDNDPAMLLGFMDNPENRKEAIELGLIRGDWTIDTDGLGEHITKDSDRKKIKADDYVEEPAA